MRLMKEEGITIIGADISTELTEDRKRKRVAATRASKEKADVIVKEKEKRKRDATSVSDK
ncbi:hypothetical protein A2U01_0109542, partial [Trifolium medium]|nr:hypothetical protein [Trifolium medium]